MALSLYLDDDDPWIIEQQIFDILNHYLQPKSNITAAAAAQSIDNLFPVNRQDDEEKEDPGSFLWHLWGRFHRTAQQIPHAHPAQDKLAALIKCLRSFPSRTPVVYLSSWDAEYKLWEDLPLLGPTFQEEWDGPYPLTPLPLSLHRKDDRLNHICIHNYSYWIDRPGRMST